MKLLYVTDRGAVGENRFWKILERLAEHPPAALELREKAMSDRQLMALARSVRERLPPPTLLLVNRRFDIALAAGADGVHLPSDGLPLETVRLVAPRGLSIGVSTHSANEARAAIEARANVVILGPIFDTPSKRAFGAPLGPVILGDLPPAAETGVAVYAIGGIDARTIRQIRPFADRIAGVAAIRMIQEAADPAEIVRMVEEVG
jgi:thiamine-phosphate pyrophosphorylase